LGINDFGKSAPAMAIEIDLRIAQVRDPRIGVATGESCSELIDGHVTAKKLTGDFLELVVVH